MTCISRVDDEVCRRKDDRSRVAGCTDICVSVVDDSMDGLDRL